MSPEAKPFNTNTLQDNSYFPKKDLNSILLKYGLEEKELSKAIEIIEKFSLNICRTMINAYMGEHESSID